MKFIIGILLAFVFTMSTGVATANSNLAQIDVVSSYDSDVIVEHSAFAPVSPVLYVTRKVATGLDIITMNVLSYAEHDTSFEDCMLITNDTEDNGDMPIDPGRNDKNGCYNCDTVYEDFSLVFRRARDGLMQDKI